MRLAHLMSHWSQSCAAVATNVPVYCDSIEFTTAPPAFGGNSATNAARHLGGGAGLGQLSILDLLSNPGELQNSGLLPVLVRCNAEQRSL